MADLDPSSPAPPLEAWRRARAALSAQRAAGEDRLADLAREVRAAYAAAAPPRKRATLALVPGRFALWDFAPLERGWHDALTAAQVEAARPGVDAACTQVAALIAADCQARRAVDLLAAEVPEPVVGDGATWRLVLDRWPGGWSSQGTGAETYARASASLRARDLLAVGYRVRTVTRLSPPREDGRRGPWYVRAFEVWAWTCEEGALVARHQRPAQTYDDALRAAQAEGVNPTALYGGIAAPIADVIRAGADVARQPAPAPAQALRWERLEVGEPLPEEGAP